MANAEAWSIGSQLGAQLAAHHRDRREMLSDEQRQIKVNSLLSNADKIQKSLSSLQGDALQNAKQQLQDIHVSVQQAYNPIHNPGALQKDWHWLVGKIRKSTPPAALAKTTEPGTPESAITMNGQTVTMPATPAYQTVAPKAAAMTPQQRQGMAQREQARTEVEQDVAASGLTPQQQAETEFRTKSAEMEMVQRWAKQLGWSDEDIKRLQTIQLEGMSGIKSANLVGKWQVRSGTLNGQKSKLLYNEKDGRWTYLDGSAVSDELLRTGWVPDDAKPVKKVKGGIAPVRCAAGAKDCTGFVELWVDPYNPSDKSLWAYTPIEATRYDKIIKSESTSVDPFGVVSKTMRTTGPAQQGYLDLSGIGQAPQGYSGEEAATAGGPPKVVPAPQADQQALPVSDTMVTPKPKGLIAPGNIPIWNRPAVQNADGTHSSELSISIGDEQGHEVLIPTIADGKFLTPDGKMPPGPMPKEGEQPSPEWKALFDNAVAHYRQTGENLGIFDNPANASAYANMLHSRKPRAGHPKPAAQPAPAAAPQAGAAPATPQQVRAQVPSVPSSKPVGTYENPLPLDPTGHVPANAPINPLVRASVDRLLDGANIDQIGLTRGDRAMVESVAQQYGWQQGLFNPKDKLLIREAGSYLKGMRGAPSLKVLDSLLSREKLLNAVKSADDKGGFFSNQIAVMSNLNPQESDFLQRFLQVRGTVSGLSQLTRGGRTTEAGIRRLTSELPDPLTVHSSKVAQMRLDRLLSEIDVAQKQGYIADTDPLDNKKQQVQQMLNNQPTSPGDIWIGNKHYTYNGSGDTGDLKNYTEVKQ